MRPQTHSVASLLADVPNLPQTMVSGVSLDSRLLNTGDLYIAVSGASTHGLVYVDQLIEKRVAAVLVDEQIDRSMDSALAKLKLAQIPVGRVPNLKQRVGQIAAEFYGKPSQQLDVIAVTGTDGKTSVCLFIASALRELGVHCGYIGTLGWGFEKLDSTELTTPDAVTLQRMLAELYAKGAVAVALEASSHGIAEGRLDAVNIDIAVQTNFGRDHLDYHQTLERYKAAKASLFHWPGLRAIVANQADELGAELLANTALPRCAYSSETSDAALQARDIELSSRGIKFELVDEARSHRVNSSLFGRFNVDNLLASHGALRALGHAANDCVNALNKLKAVPGRMEQFTASHQPTVVVDYAHTPQALESAIAALRQHTDGVLWIVFGCGGDRDKGKRLPMGRAAEAADHVIVTDDNPRGETSQDIINAILDGMKNPERVAVIADRQAAITHAIASAAPQDVVLVAGKGHEEYQITNGVKLPFSDRAIVEALLKEAC